MRKGRGGEGRREGREVRMEGGREGWREVGGEREGGREGEMKSRGRRKCMGNVFHAQSVLVDTPWQSINCLV